MERIYLNDGWRFAFDYNSAESEEIRIPHTVKETPFHYFSEDEYQTVSRYERVLFAPETWRGKRVLLTFDGVGHYAEVSLGGEKIGEHNSGYTAFTIDITDRLTYGSENALVVKVDSRETLNTPPFGNVIDYMTYGGIYRDVYIDLKNPTYISDVFAKPRMSGEIESEVTVSGEISADMKIKQSIIVAKNEIRIAENDAKSSLLLSARVENITPWDVDNPSLYTLNTELWQGDKLLDRHLVRIGFRDAEYRKDGFYLNGKKLKLRGLNRHQAYPYVGYAMPRSMQEMDADLLKYELGLNTVRTSHYPQSHYFIDRCDEIGLLVVTEMPGWQHIGDKEWQKQAVKNTEEMVLQYRNHPSIILWGVRINESRDNEALYTETNALAHRLDPTRQTGGIRCIKKSQLLEDVYTYNDFVHNGIKPGCEPKAAITPDTSKPYMVTEYAGHMYPTKSYDCEDHRTEHALRHARVLDAIASHSDISGSCGWCMSDYNTHKDFGSGDRICYHGVTDMFRNPKLAAAVYAAQAEAPMLQVSSSMDIGEHPAGVKGDIWAFTNADSLRVYKNDRFIKEYTTSANEYFSHLKHNPILIDDFIGDAISTCEGFGKRQARLVSDIINYIARHGYGKLPAKILWKAAQCMVLYGMKYNDIVDLYTKHGGDWGGNATVYRFDAIKDGKVVKSVLKAPMNKGSIEARAYRTTLTESGSYDVAAIRLRAVDENGNTLCFSGEPVCVSIDGPLEIIGPSVSPLRGGMGGIYLKTTGKPGPATVTIDAGALGKARVDFTVNI